MCTCTCTCLHVPACPCLPTCLYLPAPAHACLPVHAFPPMPTCPPAPACACAHLPPHAHLLASAWYSTWYSRSADGQPHNPYLIYLFLYFHVPLLLTKWNVTWLPQGYPGILPYTVCYRTSYGRGCNWMLCEWIHKCFFPYWHWAKSSHLKVTDHLDQQLATFCIRLHYVMGPVVWLSAALAIG
ncbi:hypothetical protein BJV74DRAFT_799717 [Russula compacta]|nr:hypothetical protein BJV74DRAFT_799717 [Russula compacta]